CRSGAGRRPTRRRAEGLWATRRLRRLRRHHPEKGQPLVSGVTHPVVFPGGRTSEVARTELALLVADADEAPARHHVVELVADGVPVAGLLLARLGAGGGPER